MSQKLIFDQVHGYLELSQLCIKIIDTPEFQRLRDLKQLGTCMYVFPGATHTRFEHSLGVCHLTGKLIRAIQVNQPDLEITDRQVELLMIAGLCHDLGHGPFSHVFDNEFLADVSKNIPEREHENRSIMIFDNLVRKNDIPLTDQEIDLVKRIIHPHSNNQSDQNNDGNSESDEGFIFEVVANMKNGIDTDKFDYISRDIKNIGLTYGYDYSRLLKQPRVIDNHICYPDKMAFNIYELFQTRYHLHKDVYNHPVAKAIEYMVVDALKLADPVLKIKESITDPEKFTQFTDSVLIQIEHSDDERLQEARDLIRRIRYRKIYKYIGALQYKDNEEITPEYIIEVGKMLIEKAIVNGDGECDSDSSEHNDDTVLLPDEEDIIIQHLRIGYPNNGQDPTEHILFYKTKKPNKSFRMNKTDVSRLLPAEFSESILRLFYRGTSEKKIKFLEQIWDTLSSP